MREVECQISKIIINEKQDGQVIWIQEKDGGRAFAVIVGFFEANALRDRVKGFNPPRPMTHNLVANVIHDLGGRLERVVVTELKNNTYYARLVVGRDGQSVRIDARPSDALVVAVQEDAPIYVAEDVLNEAGKWTLAPHIDISLEDLEDSLGDDFGEDNEGDFDEDE
ncbi:MAG: bifunctional nuclease family protein [Planctomycetes bacterium]|nr:bifunctional nuclease family protein [Planctomycetota bacterium]